MCRGHMNNTIHRQGKLRADKVSYKDGVGCCVWYPFPDGDDEDTGICFDFSYEDIDDIILLLQHLKLVAPDVYEETA